MMSAWYLECRANAPLSVQQLSSSEAAFFISDLNVSSFNSCKLISTLASPPSIADRAREDATARSDHIFLLVIGLSVSMIFLASEALRAIERGTRVAFFRASEMR